jgi:hypothetical protein
MAKHGGVRYLAILIFVPLCIIVLLKLAEQPMLQSVGIVGTVAIDLGLLAFTTQFLLGCLMIHNEGEQNFKKIATGGLKTFCYFTLLELGFLVVSLICGIAWAGLRWIIHHT